MYCHACPYVVYIYIFICRIFVYRRVHGRFYRLYLKRIWSSWRFQENDTEMTDAEMVVDEAVSRKEQNAHMTGVVNSCQGKVAGVLF